MSERATKYLSIRELRPKLPSVLRDVGATYARYIVTRRGKPEAVLLSVEAYEGLMNALQGKAQRRQQALLREGYRAMAAEAKAVTRDFAALDRESLAHVD